MAENQKSAAPAAKKEDKGPAVPKGSPPNNPYHHYTDKGEPYDEVQPDGTPNAGKPRLIAEDGKVEPVQDAEGKPIEEGKTVDGLFRTPAIDPVTGKPIPGQYVIGGRVSG